MNGQRKVDLPSVGLDGAFHPKELVEELVAIDRVGTFAREVNGEIE